MIAWSRGWGVPVYTRLVPEAPEKVECRRDQAFFVPATYVSFRA